MLRILFILYTTCCVLKLGAEKYLKVYGLQKLTLLDYPGKLACTLFTGGCNLRCPFCHNASLVKSCNSYEAIPEKDFFAFLEKRRGTLDGVCVTGGEPLLQPDLEAFLKRIKANGFLVKLDTNGCFPDKLKALVAQGLVDYVAMDIKSSLKQYNLATGLQNIDLSGVRESIAFLLTEPIDYEFRTTVVKGLHDAVSLCEAAQLINGAKRYFLQKFVDSGDLLGRGLSSFSDNIMRNFLSIVSPYVKMAALRGL